MSESIQSSSATEHTESPSRRKKATRACFHCQKAHLTCDDSRPCQRCIKRDLAASCTDGIRKKAKYLQDSNYDGITSQTPNQPLFIHNGHNGFPSTPNNIIDPSTLFGSNNGFPLTPGTTTTANVNYGFGSEAVNLEYSILSNIGIVNEMGMIENNWQHHPSLQRTSPIITASGSGIGSNLIGKKKMYSNTPENVYANVKKPFSMEKDHIERIVRALATFRPSFIALIMNLTEEDLIFMEKCFQRTILEFEKLISFSGTPTVVWRRTGEIALVGKEFSLLTQWTKDQLLGKTTYIYEVMDNQSAVEYWEKFACHAFNNSRQSVMTTCILIRPSGIPVPCAFCFTIKRDIFDIPLAIVGNVTQEPTEEHIPDSEDPRWVDLFIEYFLDNSDSKNDDLLFFVRKQDSDNEHLDPVFVKRKSAPRVMPQLDDPVLWKETFFLNLIVQLPCKLTVAVCTRTQINPSNGDVSVSVGSETEQKTSMTCSSKHVSKRVYALPTKSRMDIKDSSMECSYPLIYYVIDDYEDMFEHLIVTKGAASYSALLNIYKQKSESKISRRFKMGPVNPPTEYIMMRDKSFSSDPESLKCCMTFVNIPWTSIIT
ncbi:3637_t:CDS:10 [Diversispora eburnea]|uniref:3637_t:CDS:1 n=1 Tax=Diversispora eburnea TaxID=1213867 RepID=A0A9N8ZV11_9GLOM|nr:3637_t:CDS:10 [Diversispora eburnea]